MSDLHILNGFASMAVAVVLAAGILSDRIKDGVIVKTGLIAMVCGLVVDFMLTMDNSKNLDAYATAGLVAKIGLIVVLGGALLRVRRRSNQSKKKSVAHSERTNQQINVMAEQARDLADLYIASKPAPLEKEEHGRTKV